MFEGSSCFRTCFIPDAWRPGTISNKTSSDDICLVSSRNGPPHLYVPEIEYLYVAYGSNGLLHAVQRRNLPVCQYRPCSTRNPVSQWQQTVQPGRASQLHNGINCPSVFGDWPSPLDLRSFQQKMTWCIYTYLLLLLLLLKNKNRKEFLG